MIWILLPLSIASLDWIALARGWVQTDYLAKPGTLLALMAWLWLYVQPWAGDLAGYILIALFFSLIGDVLLMLPNEQFLGGLGAFLVAHLAYCIALFPTGLPLLGPLLGLALIIGILWWALFWPICAGLLAKNKAGLVTPVLAYTLVINIMLLSAWSTLLRESWPLVAAVVTAGGATLFFVSDLLLAWNRFVRPIPSARLYVRILYHLGQIALAAGAALVSPFI